MATAHSAKAAAAVAVSAAAGGGKDAGKDASAAAGASAGAAVLGRPPLPAAPPPARTPRLFRSSRASCMSSRVV